MFKRQEAPQYALIHFSRIAHPQLKLAWAALLFRNKKDYPEINTCLRKALDARETARTLQTMLGPDFEEFKEQVIRAYERTRETRVELVKERTLDAFPKFSAGFAYTHRSMIFAPGPLLCAVRPNQQRGELILHDLEKSTTKRLPIPQPPGFQAKRDFSDYFDHPVLTVNARGDLLCRWTIEGHGDHGLALLKKGSDSFTVKRVKLFLDNCLVTSDRDGTWYLPHGGPRFTLYQIDAELNLKRLGHFEGRGFHTVRIADARFIADGLLHVFWADVLADGNHLRMRSVDFDVTRKRWLHNRELFRLDKFVSDASDPTVLQLADGSVHYLWRIDGGLNVHAAVAGTFYQPEAESVPLQIDHTPAYWAVAVGNRIVECSSLETAPEKVFFSVINRGVVLPGGGSILPARGRKYNLDCEDMLLYAEAGRIWFVNTLERTKVYELKLVEAKNP